MTSGANILIALLQSMTKEMAFYQGICPAIAPLLIDYCLWNVKNALKLLVNVQWSDHFIYKEQAGGMAAFVCITIYQLAALIIDITKTQMHSLSAR